MKILFLKDAPKIGKRGEIKEINDGYAINFIIPNKIGIPADNSLVKKVNKEKKDKEISLKNKLNEISNILSSIDGQKITIKAKSNDIGHLFAKINISSFILSIKKQINVEIQESWVEFPEIKTVGEYKIKISYQDMKANLTLFVERE